MLTIAINDNLTLDNSRMKNEKKKDNCQQEKKLSVSFETFRIEVFASNKAYNNLNELYNLIPPQFHI